MKIVQFKNKSYGVRKWTIFGYRFLSASGRSWLPNEEHFEASFMMSSVQLERVLEKIRNRYVARDMGVPLEP